MARAFHPEVVLCDIGLPDMDGYAVARRLNRIRSPPSRLIAVTGYGSDEDGSAAEAGFAVVLTKPVEPDELERVLADPAALPGC